MMGMPLYSSLGLQHTALSPQLTKAVQRLLSAAEPGIVMTRSHCTLSTVLHLGLRQCMDSSLQTDLIEAQLACVHQTSLFGRRHDIYKHTRHVVQACGAHASGRPCNSALPKHCRRQAYYPSATANFEAIEHGSSGTARSSMQAHSAHPKWWAMLLFHQYNLQAQISQGEQGNMRRCSSLEIL